jgi:hypothetical protein
VASTTILAVHMDTVARRSVAFPDRVIQAAMALLPSDSAPATSTV